jgi:hypothetical protein
MRLIAAFLESWAPIFGQLIGILSANGRIYRLERHFTYAVAPYRKPIETCYWRTGFHWNPGGQLS